MNRQIFFFHLKLIITLKLRKFNVDKIEEFYSSKLKDLFIKNEKIIEILKILKTYAPQAYLAAGVIRNTVWAHLHGQSFSLDQTEIDVIFYDPQDNGHKALELQKKMINLFPNIEWDITNQAKVHVWYQTDTGTFIPPLRSIEHALSLWSETATAIAVHLNDQDEIEYIAPFGLADLFELKLCWNQRLVSRDVFLARLNKKKFLEKWPKLQIIF